MEILFEWTIPVVFAVGLWVANIRRSRVFSLLAIAGVIPLTASAGRNSSAPTKEDLALLAQCEVIEHRFERRDLIFPSATIEEHLATVSAFAITGRTSGRRSMALPRAARSARH